MTDVLHHVDNPEEVIREIKRISKRNSRLIIIEANRYNPLFYIHMTKMLGHNHFTRGNFMNLITENFSNVEFKFVESHVWPTNNKFITSLLHKIEKIIDRIFFCCPFLAYNIAIIKV
jgi:ubiquinone/menaquinone biosynthesis C-methylase UbiE